MRRLFRILFNVVTVLSLVLLAGTAGLWVRGARTSDVVWLDADGRQYRIVSTAGRFEWLNAPLAPEPEQRQFPLLTSKFDEEQGRAALPAPPPTAVAPRAARPWHWVVARYPTPWYCQSPCDWHACGLGRYSVMMESHPSGVYGSATVWVASYGSVCSMASALPVLGMYRWRRGRR